MHWFHVCQDHRQAKQSSHTLTDTLCCLLSLYFTYTKESCCHIKSAVCTFIKVMPARKKNKHRQPMTYQFHQRRFERDEPFDKTTWKRVRCCSGLFFSWLLSSVTDYIKETFLKARRELACFLTAPRVRQVCIRYVVVVLTAVSPSYSLAGHFVSQ